MFGLNKRRMRGALIALLISMLLIVSAPFAVARMGFLIEEDDGDPAGFSFKLKVPDDSLSITGSTATLSIAGGGDLTGITAGDGIRVDNGATATPDVHIDFNENTTDLEGTAIALTDVLLYMDSDNSDDMVRGLVSDLPFSDYLPLAGGTLTGEVTVDNLGFEFTEGDDHSDCSAFSATGGGLFYDDSEGVFKKCQDSTLTDLDTGGTVNTADIADVGVEQTELAELETIGATTISANQWAAIGGLAETLTAAEVNILDGVSGVTAAELSYIGDVTGLIQAQIDATVASVGDCASGACQDGTSDGGTYLRLYDGDSHYLEINPGNLAANETFDPTDYTGTASWVREASPVFTTNITTPQITITGSDASPDAAGEVRYDSTVEGLSGGAVVWFDNDSVRTFVDLETLPSDDDHVVAYDAAADGFYMKDDDDTGGNTDYENIGDPGAPGSIAFGAHTGTYTSGTEAWGGLIIESSDADNDGDTTLLTLKHYDDFDTNSIFLHLINDSDGGADDLLKVTGLGVYIGAASPTQSMTGDDLFVSGFLEVDGVLYADGGITAASATPKAVLDDTGGADAYWDNNAADADDAVATFGVDDSGGDDQSYIELDGVNERIEMKEDVIIEVTLDAGGATSFEVENNNNPTTAAAGDIAVDANHNMLEIFGDASYSIPTEFPIYISVAEPDTMDARDFIPIFTNNTGASITIVSIYAMADDDDTDFRIEEFDADGSGNEALVKAETCDTGAGPYTNDAQDTITNATIETGHILVLDFDDTDTPDYLHLTIWYTVGGVN